MASSTASIVCMYMTTIGIYQKINYEDVYYGTLGLRLKYSYYLGNLMFIDLNDINAIITGLNVTKAHGPDLISANIVKL